MAVNIIDAKLKFRYPLRNMSEITAIVIHHDNNHNLTNPNSIHKYHLSKGWSGIGYNYIVYSDGDIYKGRGIKRAAHCKGANHYSLGICISGDFHGSDAMTPTIQQMKSASDLIKQLLREYPSIKTIKMHREIAKKPTACPGNKFPMKELIVAVNQHEPRQYKRALRYTRPLMRGIDVRDLQVKLNSLNIKCGVVDGIFGDKTESAVKKYQKRLYPHNGIVSRELWGSLFE